MCPGPLPQPGCGRTQGAEGGGGLVGARGVPFLAGKGLSWRPRVSCRLQLRRRQEPEQPVQEHAGLCQVTAPGLGCGSPAAPEQSGAGAPPLPAGAMRLGQAWEGQPGTPGGASRAGAVLVPHPGVSGVGWPRCFAVGSVGLDWQHRAGPRVSAVVVGQFRLHHGADLWGSMGLGRGAGPWGCTVGLCRGPWLCRDPRVRSPALLSGRPADTARPWERRARLRGRGVPHAGVHWGPALPPVPARRPPPAGSFRGCRWRGRRRGKAEPRPSASPQAGAGAAGGRC